jgi:hypothetical protein
MSGQAEFADAIRKTAEAYAEALSAVMKALEALPKTRGDEYRQQAEQWLGLARMGKDGAVAAIQQGFDLWERECRQLVGAPHGPTAASAENPMLAWAEAWRKTVEGLSAAGRPGEAWSEAARRQAEMAGQMWQESLRAWQRLWPPPPR